MGFIVKIYFLGLVAFLPDQDGQEMTVLLLDARDSYALSDGTSMAPHEPLLLARAAQCRGDCRAAFQEIADFLFQVESPEENARLMTKAIAGGGAWRLDGSELSIRLGSDAGAGEPSGLEIRGRAARATPQPAAQPANRKDFEDFDWVAEMHKIESTLGMIDPDVLAERPQKGLIAARLKLAMGQIHTERLITLDDQVVELAFEPLTGPRRRSGYSQALADWVVAQIPVPGCEVTVHERRFDGEPGRSLTLAPEKCDGSEVVEVVLVNLPRDSFGPRPDHEVREEIGKHFEMYYELAYLRPPNHLRPVPVPARSLPKPPKRAERPQRAEPTLLSALGLPGRGPHSRPLCPVSQFSGVPPAAVASPEASRAR